MIVDQNVLKQRYEQLPTEELVQLFSEGEFTDTARSALETVLVGRGVDPASFPQQVEVAAAHRDDALKGLGGWLILVRLGLITALAPSIWILRREALNVVSALFTVLEPSIDKAESIPWLLACLVMFALYLSWTLALVYGLVLYFGRKKGFPKWYIFLRLGALFVPLGIWCVFVLIGMGSPELNTQVMRVVVFAFFGACIWIPYISSSRRVQVTFVE